MSKHTLDSTIHRFFAIQFNQAFWKMLSKPSITVEEGYELIDIAHASNHHWRFAGTALHKQRGAYVIARVYLAVGRPDTAMIYAKRCMEMTNENPEGIKDFDYAFAHEILWKCTDAKGLTEEAAKHKAEARRLGDLIVDPEDKKIFDGDFETVYTKVINN